MIRRIEQKLTDTEPEILVGEILERVEKLKKYLAKHKGDKNSYLEALVHNIEHETKAVFWGVK